MKYNKEEWENLATCIKTEQVPPRDVYAIFKDCLLYTSPSPRD